MCACQRPHDVRLEGSATTKAAEYLPRFCAEYAAAAARCFRADPPRLGEAEAEAMCQSTPPVFEKLWVNDLLRALPWRTSSARPIGGETTSTSVIFALLSGTVLLKRGSDNHFASS